MVRVNFILDTPSPHMTDFIEAISRRDDLDVHLFYLLPANKRFMKRVRRIPNIRTTVLSGRDFPFNKLGLLVNTGIFQAIAKKCDITVVSAGFVNPIAQIIVRWLSLAGKPWVYMNEVPRLDRGKAFIRAFKSIGIAPISRQPLAILAMGHEKRWRQVAHYGVPLYLCPFYCDFSRFQAIRQHEQLTGPLRLLFVGELNDKRKGLDILLKSLQKLKQGEIFLRIIGNGALRDDFEHKAKSLLGNDVQFLGHVPYDEVHHTFNNSDLFVLPTRHDGWAMVVPEALAAGLPVISTTACGAALHFIRNGYNGFIVEPGDVEGTAKAIQFFLDKREQLPQFSGNARKSVEGHTPEKGACLFSDILHQVTGKPGGPEIAVQPMIDEARREADILPRSLRFRLRSFGRKVFLRCASFFSRASHSSPLTDKCEVRILNYHYVFPDQVANFRSQIEAITEHARFISLEKAYEYLTAGGPAGRYCVITFDDGFRNVMQNALPVLDEMGIKAAFFAYTDFADSSNNTALALSICKRVLHLRGFLKPMSWEDLAELLQRGHSIESHGISHVPLWKMGPEAAAREMEECGSVIKHRLNISPSFFAFPYKAPPDIANGSWDNVLSRTGYRAFLSTWRGPNLSGGSQFWLRRETLSAQWPIWMVKYFVFRGLRGRAR